jgi:hypothetical protein
MEFYNEQKEETTRTEETLLEGFAFLLSKVNAYHVSRNTVWLISKVSAFNILL